MRKAIFLLGLGILVTAGCIAYGPYDEGMGGAAVGGDIGVGYFYDYLSPYGNWVNSSPWGFVWCPAGVGFEWQPYSYGEWLWTDDGWFWDSFDEWGWAPFHYGRWGWDDGLGWFWVPGSTWGPAWVTWCWNDSYVGWAPLPPGAAFRAGFGIGSLPGILDRSWCFVDGRDFLGRDLDRRILPFERNRTILADAQSRGNISWSGERVFNGGISRDRIQAMTRASVVRYGLANADRPGPSRVEGSTIRAFQSQMPRTANARPQNFLERGDAARRLSDMRLDREASPQGAPSDEMRQRQARELDLLQRSQEQERTVLQQRQQDAAGRAASEADRNKVTRQYEQRAQALQRQHEQERAQIQQRHEQERQAAQSRPRRKSP